MANSRELAQFASFVNFTGSSIGFSTHFNVSGVSTFTNAVIFDNTGYIQVPAGNTAQRDITGIAVTFGQVRYNTQLSQFEGFGAGDAWGSLGGVKDVDGDTFIRAESAAGEDEDKLEFLTGDTTRVVIDSTGQVGIGTTIPNATLDVTGNINIVGVSTFSDNVEVPSDSKKILLGAEKEMQVFHNGTDSLIKDTRNSGSVKIQADKFAVIDKDASETMLFATVGAAVTLSYGGNTKFETTSTGIKISNGTTATIVGPDEIVIDPATVGDNTGTVRIKGDLFVDGTQTQINSTTLELADFVVGVATTATTDLLTDGAGIGIGSDKTFLYEHNSGTNPSLKSSENLNVASGKVYQIGETERLSTDTLSVGTGATVHSPDSNVLTLGTNSSERIRVDSSGRVLIGTTVEGHTSAQNLTVGNNTSGHSGITIRSSPSYIGSLYFSDATSSPAEYSGFLQYSHNGNFLSLGTDTTEKLRITSDGRVLLGIQTPRAGVFNTNLITPFFQMESAGQVDHNRMMTLVSNPGSTGGYEPVFIFGKSRGTSAGDFGAVGNNDGLGIISFQGADGAELVEAARISAAVDGAVNTANDMPGRLDFWVTKDGASAPVNPTMRIHNTGYMNVGGYIDSNDINRLNGINSLQGTHIATISGYQSTGGSTQDTMLFNAVNASGSANASGCAVKVYRNDTTLRSINAAGTVNTSGNDYAEYMVKAGDFTIAKGDICGVNAQGKLTNVFADAVTFVVKSTDPSYVGGDTWDTAAGEEPGGYDDTRTGEELEAAKVAYQEQLEIVRQTVDRIAFSGQTPVNVTGSTPGQHIIPTANSDGSISGTAKSEGDLTLAEYMSSVGKVIAIEEDGRAKIIVKVS